MSEENNVFFAVGSWWAAVASGLWPLVAARAIQAVGGGGMVPVALAATAALYGGRARELALGAIAGAAEAASAEHWPRSRSRSPRGCVASCAGRVSA
jgi:predicted MFS family arabinose efflux permease